ncbi:hypothetical protein C8J57DRAFT_1250595 [Mycena rebaudengoi]|nr:hypothetical protein C8J57DRAFT_1250595 [Mycena rebaudengoi]
MWATTTALWATGAIWIQPSPMTDSLLSTDRRAMQTRARNGRLRRRMPFNPPAPLVPSPALPRTLQHDHFRHLAPSHRASSSNLHPPTPSARQAPLSLLYHPPSERSSPPPSTPVKLPTPLPHNSIPSPSAHSHSSISSIGTGTSAKAPPSMHRPTAIGAYAFTIDVGRIRVRSLYLSSAVGPFQRDSAGYSLSRRDTYNKREGSRREPQTINLELDAVVPAVDFTPGTEYSASCLLLSQLVRIHSNINSTRPQNSTLTQGE